MRRRLLKLISVVSGGLFLVFLVLWLRSSFVVDIVQFGDAYVIRTADELGFHGAVGARVTAAFTAPGSLYLFHRGEELPSDELVNAKRRAWIGGLSEQHWASYGQAAFVNSETARETTWPRGGYKWELQRKSASQTAILQAAVPMWLLTLCAALPAGWMGAVMFLRRRLSMTRQNELEQTDR